MQFERVLFVSQGTADDSESLKQALNLAQRTGATLHALIAVPPFPKALEKYSAPWKRSLLDRLTQAVNTCASALQISPVPVIAATVESGDKPALRIIRDVLRHEYDLLIKQAEPLDTHSGFSALDMELLRQCPCPVWLCRPIARPGDQIRVGVAIDPVHDDAVGHELAVDLLKVSRALANAYSGELTVISCWDYEFEEDLRHSPWLQIPENELSETVAHAESSHRAALDRIVGEAALEGNIRIHHLKGRPDTTIPRFVADAHIDILLMGSVARTGIPGFVMGNTAENVLRRLYASLLVLKPRGFVSAIKAYE